MAYGKGRATGYSDFYKGRDRTPGGSYDDEENGPRLNISMSMGRTMSNKDMQQKDMAAEDKKKAAIRRRLQRMRAGK